MAEGNARVGEIELWWEDVGPKDAPVVLLVMGANILNAVTLASSPDDTARVLLSLAASLAIALVSMFTMTISQAATMVAVSRVHLSQPVSIGAAFAGLKGRLFRLCFITIGLIMLILLCFLLLIVPGIYVMLRWSLAIPVVVLERTGLSGGMARSAALVPEVRHTRLRHAGLL